MSKLEGTYLLAVKKHFKTKIGNGFSNVAFMPENEMTNFVNAIFDSIRQILAHKFTLFSNV